MVGLVIPPHTPIEKVRDLTGKTLGLVQGPAGDARILDQILAYYQIPADKLQRVALAPGEIGPAIRQKRVAAMFALGPAGPGPLADVVTAVAKAGKGTLTILEIEAADAIAQRFPLLESVDIPAGAFGTTPLRPQDSVSTLSVTMRLVARASMSNYVAGEVARLLFVTKAKLAPTFPQVGFMEVPDTTVGAALPFHPGATAYYNGGSDEPAGDVRGLFLSRCHPYQRHRLRLCLDDEHLASRLEPGPGAAPAAARHRPGSPRR